MSANPYNTAEFNLYCFHTLNYMEKHAGSSRTPNEMLGIVMPTFSPR